MGTTSGQPVGQYMKPSEGTHSDFIVSYYRRKLKVWKPGSGRTSAQFSELIQALQSEAGKIVALDPEVIRVIAPGIYLT